MSDRGETAQEKIEPLIEKLIKNLEATEPRDGKSRHLGKLELAQESIDVWWQLSSVLVGWAHNHIIGYQMAQESEELRNSLVEAFELDTLTPNSHALEFLGRSQNWEYWPYDDETEILVEKGINFLDEKGLKDLTDSALRRAIGKIFYSKNHVMSATRRRLMDSIMEVEHGGKVNLFTPPKNRRVNSPLVYDRTRGMIIAHIYFRTAKGIKKYVALEQVSEEVPYSVETLRSWEKELSDFDWIRFWWNAVWIAGAYETEIQGTFEDTEVIDKLVDVYEQWGDVSNIEFALEFLRNHEEGFLSLQNLAQDLKRHSKKVVAKD